MSDNWALEQSIQTALQDLLVKKGHYTTDATRDPVAISPNDTSFLKVHLATEPDGHTELVLGVNEQRLGARHAEIKKDMEDYKKSPAPLIEFNKRWGFEQDRFAAITFNPFASNKAGDAGYQKNEGAIFSMLGHRDTLIQVKKSYPDFDLQVEKQGMNEGKGISISVSRYRTIEGLTSLQRLILSLNDTVLEPAGVAPIDLQLVDLSQEKLAQLFAETATANKATAKAEAERAEAAAARKAAAEAAAAHKAAEQAAAEAEAVAQEAAFDAKLKEEALKKAAKLPSVGKKTEDAATTDDPIIAASEEEAETAAKNAAQNPDTWRGMPGNLTGDEAKPAEPIPTRRVYASGKPTPSPLSSAIARVLEGRDGQNNGSLPGF